MSITAAARPTAAPRERIGPEEWQARVELAACYRMMVKHRMTDLTATHVSLRVPGQDEHYLLNPYGLLFEEITASNLVKFDLDGNILDGSQIAMNPAGYAIHGAVHRARADARCVIHSHTRAGSAVGALKEGLLPLNQVSMIFYDRVAYNDYVLLESIDQCDRLVADLGDHKAMIMRNHGLLTTGRSVGEAFILMHYLDKACEIQMDVLSTGREIELPTHEVCEDAAKGWWAWYGDTPFGEMEWEALVRRLDEGEPSYKQ